MSNYIELRPTNVVQFLSNDSLSLRHVAVGDLLTGLTIPQASVNHIDSRCYVSAMIT